MGTVWYLDPTLVTLLSLISLFLSLADYLGPKILDKIFKPESWTGEKEKRLEGGCQSLVSLSLLLSSLSFSLSSMLVAMLPGLHRRGLLEKHCSAVISKLREM